MPLQNRVTPFSALEASAARGLWMGNRGLLHNDRRQIVRSTRNDLDRWLICLLKFRNIHRQVMRPRHYTELFFLDEATALAAGHRPCFECRRADAVLFASLCEQATARALDQVLGSERRAVRRVMPISLVPDGAFVTVNGVPLLKWQDRLHTWTHFGYQPQPASSAENGNVAVLTPPLTCRALAAGYPVQVHPSVA